MDLTHLKFSKVVEGGNSHTSQKLNEIREKQEWICQEFHFHPSI
jgi:hypothetical protein